MPHILKINLKLLRASFSHQEWALLKRNVRFKAQLKNANSTFDDFEELVRLGNGIVCDWEIESLRAKFQR